LARFLQTHLFNSHFLFTQLDETDDEEKQESLLFVEQDKDFTDDLEHDNNDLDDTKLDNDGEELDEELDEQ